MHSGNLQSYGKENGIVRKYSKTAINWNPIEP